VTYSAVSGSGSDRRSAVRDCLAPPREAAALPAALRDLMHRTKCHGLNVNARKDFIIDFTCLGALFDAYQAAAGIDAGWLGRAPIYNLYHLLNHLNLFGAGYLEGMRGMLQRV